MGNQPNNPEKQFALVKEILNGLIEMKDRQEKTEEIDRLRFEALKSYTDSLNNKINAVDDKMESYKDIFDSLQSFVDSTKDVVLSLEAKLDERFEELAEKFDTDFKDLVGDLDQEWRRIETQLNELEEKMIIEFKSLAAGE